MKLFGDGRVALRGRRRDRGAARLGPRRRSRPGPGSDSARRGTGDPRREPWIAPPWYRPGLGLDVLRRRPASRPHWTLSAGGSGCGALPCADSPSHSRPRGWSVAIAGLGRVGGVAATVLAATPSRSVGHPRAADPRRRCGQPGALAARARLDRAVAGTGELPRCGQPRPRRGVRALRRVPVRRDATACRRSAPRARCAWSSSRPIARSCSGFLDAGSARGVHRSVPRRLRPGRLAGPVGVLRQQLGSPGALRGRRAGAGADRGAWGSA